MTRRQAFTKAFVAFGYVASVPLMAFALMRIFRFEDNRFAVIFETGTNYIFLAAYPLIAIALLAKERVLAVIATFFVLFHLAAVLPELAHSRSVSDERTDNATRLTLFSQNVLFDNKTPTRIGEQIKTEDADFVFLQELSAPVLKALEAANAFDSYKFSAVHATYGAKGLGVWSKYPLANDQFIQFPGLPQQRVQTTVNGKSLVLWNIHNKSPVDGALSGWRGDLKELKARFHAETAPTLIAGDFNSTWGHRPFREIVTHGIHEAAVDVGRGYARTWPVDRPNGVKAKGYIRIDHVLYNSGLQATDLRELPGNGSDHRGILADVVLFN